MTPTLSPRALLREAVALRLAEDPRLTHQTIADRAGIPRTRVSEALNETRGEPRPETVERVLRALGFAMGLVDVRDAPELPSAALVTPHDTSSGVP